MTNDEIMEFLDQDNLEYSTEQLFKEQQLNTIGHLIELRDQLEIMSKQLTLKIAAEQAKYFGIY